MTRCSPISISRWTSTSGARSCSVPGYIEQRGEPIVNPVTGAEHRIRIEPEGGFEFKVAEIGRGWTKTSGPITYELTDSYGQFAELHLCQDGIIA